MTFANDEALQSAPNNATEMEGNDAEAHGGAHKRTPSDVNAALGECAEQCNEDEGGHEASLNRPESPESIGPEDLVPSSPSVRARKNHRLAVSFSEQTNLSGRSHRSVGKRQPQSPSLASTSVNSVTSVASLGSPGPCTCFTWHKQRLQVALLGCTSSFCVLAARLYLDIGRSTSWSTTYLIHALIILIDMLLIHLFTFSPWLSAGGELVTVGCFLSYHFTHETIFELLETTLIAALCSIHMIISRSKHWDHEEELVESLRKKDDLLMASHHHVSFHSNASSTAGSMQLPNLPPETATTIDEAKERENEEHDIEANVVGSQRSIPSHVHRYAQEDEEDQDSQPRTGTALLCWNHFFAHFLDGSAGVMYTSFFGLILDELVSYGINKGDSQPAC